MHQALDYVVQWNLFNTLTPRQTGCCFADDVRMVQFDLNFTEICFRGSNQHNARIPISLDDGLALHRQ